MAAKIWWIYIEAPKEDTATEKTCIPKKRRLRHTDTGEIKSSIAEATPKKEQSGTLGKQIKITADNKQKSPEGEVHKPKTGIAEGGTHRQPKRTAPEGEAHKQKVGIAEGDTHR